MLHGCGRTGHYSGVTPIQVLRYQTGQDSVSPSPSSWFSSRLLVLLLAVNWRARAKKSLTDLVDWFWLSFHPSSLDQCMLCRTIVAERQKQLASLYFVAKDRDKTDRFEAGFRSSNVLTGEVNEGELAEFVQRYSDLKG